MAQRALSRSRKTGGRPSLNESEARLQRVLDVAKRNFLVAGYPETSLDDIAKESRIAKKTIYSRFGNKAGLFSAILLPLRQSLTAELQDIAIPARRPEFVLEAAARRLLDVCTRTEMLELHRLLLVESRRFPDLIDGQYDKQGMLAYMAPLANYLRLAVREKKLQLGNVVLGTEQFVHLVLGSTRERMLHGVTKRPGASARARVAKQAVRIFLAGCRL